MGRRILGRYRAKFKTHTKRDIRNSKHKIERAYSVGDKKLSPCRTIVEKVSSFKKRNVFLQRQREGNPKLFKLMKIF